jgi:hypothetical protein
MTTKMTINWWRQTSELNDHQSENLNGGSNYTSISVGISGELGPVQINSSNGAQINLNSKNSTVRYRGYHSYHGYHSHYFY